MSDVRPSSAFTLDFKSKKIAVVGWGIDEEYRNSTQLVDLSFTHLQPCFVLCAVAVRPSLYLRHKGEEHKREGACPLQVDPSLWW